MSKSAAMVFAINRIGCGESTNLLECVATAT